MAHDPNEFNDWEGQEEEIVSEPLLPKPIKIKNFLADVWEEGSWGARHLGRADQEMRLYEGVDAGHGFIEWEIPSMDRGEEIGLTYEMRGDKRALTDYDGVMDLPSEAVELLESAGIIVDQEFKD